MKKREISEILLIISPFYVKILIKKEGIPMDNNYDVENKTVEIKSRSRLFALLSLIFGILSATLSIFGIAGIILGALAVTFAVVSRVRMSYFDSLALIGLITAIIGIATSGSLLVANELFGTGYMSLG